MAFTAITAAGTLATLRTRLATALEQQGALSVSVQIPQGTSPVVSSSVDYQRMADEALAALLNHLAVSTANQTVLTALAAARATVGV